MHSPYLASSHPALTLFSRTPTVPSQRVLLWRSGLDLSLRDAEGKKDGPVARTLAQPAEDLGSIPGVESFCLCSSVPYLYSGDNSPALTAQGCCEKTCIGDWEVCRYYIDGLHVSNLR